MRRYKIAIYIGKRIRRVRKKRGLTQEEAAEKAKIHVSTLGRIERGESNPPIQTISKIAYALGVKAKELLS